jgi:predicted RNA-binding Zn-ribbon protein involved in translation (DUF1610 family)
MVDEHQPSPDAGAADSGGGKNSSFTERLIELHRRRAAETMGTSLAPYQSGEEALALTERDIVFDCPECGGELIVDREGEGMETNCIHCETNLLVPAYQGSPLSTPKVVAKRASQARAGDDEPQDFTIASPAASPSQTTYQTVRGSAAASEDAGQKAPAPQDSSTTAAALSPQKLQEYKNKYELNGLGADDLRKRMEEVSRHLKENSSQVTEVNGYVNQTSIKLHRFQLQLEKLKQRNREIREELLAIKASLDGQ